MIDIGHIVPEAGLLPVVIDHGKEFVRPLLTVVLVPAIGGQNVFGNFEVDRKVNVFQQLLAPGRRGLVVNEPLQVKNQHRRQLVQVQTPGGFNFFFSFGTDITANQSKDFLIKKPEVVMKNVCTRPPGTNEKQSKNCYFLTALQNCKLSQKITRHSNFEPCERG
jgi:hypothetical protein